ncbi:importin subunit alpha [Culicoides brevitarsis]|uniref:importin subunit alpha n=1 Tax=Culicoides brevitarsis TaxID=469753 RepID=UPI00307CC172
MSENTQAGRIGAFKTLQNKGSQELLRQRRHDVTVELRKNKKDDQLFKRRNIHTADDEPLSPLQESNGQSPSTFNMTDIVNGLNSKDPVREFESVQAARKMLSKERNPPIDTMIGHGVVPIFVSFLERFDNPKLQFEAAWALTNIASGTSEQTNAVIQSGAVPKFIALLMSPEQNVAEQAVWALGNIAGDGPNARDFVLSHNVVDNLLRLIEKPIQNSFLRNVVWLCSNLCRNKNPHPPFEKIKPLLPVLAELLKHTDDQILADSCWALSYVTDDEADKIQAVVDSGAVPLLVNLLDSENVAIITPTLRTVGNIVTGNDVQTDAVLNANVLPRLAKLLEHKKPAIVKEAAWTVSNITAGNQDQIGYVLSSDVMANLVKVLDSGDFKSQKEAAWAITNTTTGGSTEQIIYLIEKFPVMKPFCDLLESTDARTIKVVLSGLENLFKFAEKINGVENLSMLIEEIGGLDKLENLQSHENEDIYKSSFAIVDKYFSDGTQEEEGLAPAEENGQLTFNPTANGTDGTNNFNF